MCLTALLLIVLNCSQFGYVGVTYAKAVVAPNTHVDPDTASVDIDFMRTGCCGKGANDMIFSPLVASILNIVFDVEMLTVFSSSEMVIDVIGLDVAKDH